VAAPPGLALAPGSTLEKMELLLGDRVIWSGDGIVVHGSGTRIGARFTSGILDLRQLHLEATLDSRVALLREQHELLPADWRAAVGDLRGLIETAREEVEELERMGVQDPLSRAEEETALLDGVRRRWAPAYYGAVAALHERSKALDERQLPLAHSYASSTLMPLLMPCPMHRRAYEKPLGYAGDYRMMELYFARELGGDGLFGRFLHSITQGYTLGQTVIAREQLLRDVVRATIESDGDGPVRVLSLAAGPAIELRRLLEETISLRRSVELLLLDQDAAAHEAAHRRLTRILFERHHGALPITLQCLHFSVRQLLKPQTPEEILVSEVTLVDLDLIYSAGLYDYLPDPVAARLTQLIYSRLRPGGRIFVGNLEEVPDTTWMMEFVTGWHLLYRNEQSLLRLARGLEPAPARCAIVRDATGHSMFLDVQKPS
jgi:hypothetical protein